MRRNKRKKTESEMNEEKRKEKNEMYVVTMCPADWQHTVHNFYF